VGVAVEALAGEPGEAVTGLLCWAAGAAKEAADNIVTRVNDSTRLTDPRILISDSRILILHSLQATNITHAQRLS